MTKHLQYAQADLVTRADLVASLAVARADLELSPPAPGEQAPNDAELVGVLVGQWLDAGLSKALTPQAAAAVGAAVTAALAHWPESPVAKVPGPYC